MLSFSGYTKVVTRGSGGNSDVYECKECSSVKTSSGAAITSFDCTAAANIGQPICGANALPEPSGVDWVCKCEAGFIEDSAGNCIACQVVIDAEGGTGSSSTSKLFESSKHIHIKKF